MEHSKTIKELFDAKYPVNSLKNSPLECAEAIGYLKAIEDFAPAYSEDAHELRGAVLFIYCVYHVGGNK